jgi:hypothetical protein
VAARNPSGLHGHDTRANLGRNRSNISAGPRLVIDTNRLLYECGALPYDAFVATCKVILARSGSAGENLDDTARPGRPVYEGGH